MIELKSGANWIGNGETFLYSLYPKQQKYNATNNSNRRMYCNIEYLAFGEEGQYEIFFILLTISFINLFRYYGLSIDSDMLNGHSF